MPSNSDTHRGFDIRAATLEDLEGAHGIFAEAVETGTASFALEPPSLDEMQARFHRMQDAGLPYLVACRAGIEGVEGGGILGFALADWFRPRPGYRFTLETSIYVHRDCRGGGIGSALLADVVAEARTFGAKQLIAVIGDIENSASIKLHKAQGFMYAGVLKNVGFKFDQWLDTIYMQREL